MNNSTLTTRQAAEALGVTCQNVSYLVRRGKLEATRTELGHLRIALPSVVRYASDPSRRNRTPKTAA